MGLRTHATDEATLRRDVIEVCRQLHARGYLAAADGNVSARLPGGELLVTPSGVPKAFLEPDELVRLGPDGTPRPGQGTPSGELPMHLAALRARPDAQVVVHAHPPTAIALSLHPSLVVDGVLPEVILSIGRLVVVPYARPLTDALAHGVARALADVDAVIMARHGTVAVGATLLEALAWTERVEHACEVLWRAHGFGPPAALPDDEVETLRRMYASARAAPRRVG
jgi:L-fuculose-phosphate aldolase